MKAAVQSLYESDSLILNALSQSFDRKIWEKGAEEGSSRHFISNK